MTPEIRKLRGFLEEARDAGRDTDLLEQAIIQLEKDARDEYRSHPLLYGPRGGLKVCVRDSAMEIGVIELEVHVNGHDVEYAVIWTPVHIKWRRGDETIVHQGSISDLVMSAHADRKDEILNRKQVGKGGL